MASKKCRGVDDAKVHKTQRLNVRLDVAAHQRLHVHALMVHKTPGKVLEDLIESHLRDYRVQELKAGRGDPGEHGDDASKPAPHIGGL